MCAVPTESECVIWTEEGSSDDPSGDSSGGELVGAEEGSSDGCGDTAGGEALEGESDECENEGMQEKEE